MGCSNSSPTVDTTPKNGRNQDQPAPLGSAAVGGKRGSRSTSSSDGGLRTTAVLPPGSSGSVNPLAGRGNSTAVLRDHPPPAIDVLAEDYDYEETATRSDGTPRVIKASRGGSRSSASMMGTGFNMSRLSSSHDETTRSHGSEAPLAAVSDYQTGNQETESTQLLHCSMGTRDLSFPEIHHQTGSNLADSQAGVSITSSRALESSDIVPMDEEQLLNPSSRQASGSMSPALGKSNPGSSKQLPTANGSKSTLGRHGSGYNESNEKPTNVLFTTDRDGQAFVLQHERLRAIPDWVSTIPSSPASHAPSHRSANSDSEPSELFRSVGSFGSPDPQS